MMNLTNWTPLHDLESALKRLQPLSAGIHDHGPGPEFLNADLKW
jgi:hypothetical protein